MQEYRCRIHVLLWLQHCETSEQKSKSVYVDATEQSAGENLSNILSIFKHITYKDMLSVTL